jgi:hypothetical protein
MAMPTSDAQFRAEISSRLASLQKEIAGLKAQHGGVGHNNPPGATPFEYSGLDEVIDEARDCIAGPTPDPERIRLVATQFEAKAGVWSKIWPGIVSGVAAHVAEKALDWAFAKITEEAAATTFLLLHELGALFTGWMRWLLGAS